MQVVLTKLRETVSFHEDLEVRENQRIPQSVLGIKEDKRLGILHELSEEMRLFLLTVVRLDAPKIRLNGKADLDKQRNEKERKEAVLKKYQLVKAIEHLIGALYYYEICQSPA